MIESMACGTPVLAFRCGSIPEVIEDGVTGKVVKCEEEAIAALPEILSYDRRAVRRRFEDRFTATRMAKDYVSTYRQFGRRTLSQSGPVNSLSMAAMAWLRCRLKSRFRSQLGQANEGRPPALEGFAVLNMAPNDQKPRLFCHHQCERTCLCPQLQA